MNYISANDFQGGRLQAAQPRTRLPNPAWAWEHLRRNPSYQKDFFAIRHYRSKPINLKTGATLLRERQRWPEAEKWGLLTFADPALSALEADVFWSPALLAGALPIELYNPGDSDREDQDEIVLSAIDSRRRLLDTVDGARHILLSGERFWVQLICKKPAAIADFGAVAVSIKGAKHMKRRLDTADQLLALYHSTGANLSLIGRSKNTERLTQGLLAFDILQAGGSHRDIAEAVYGQQKVAARWGGPSQYYEDWTRRLVSRVHHLIEGGYRDMLARKSL
ncbi:MAG: DUF2285 domain-containing protein [Pseudomonadota bacterium]